MTLATGAAGRAAGPADSNSIISSRSNKTALDGIAATCNRFVGIAILLRRAASAWRAADRPLHGKG